MDFLTGLKEAMAQGISKDNYITIWGKEMALKACNNETQSNTSQGSNPIDMQTGETSKENDIVSLLRQISKQQSSVQLQQDNIQQQLKDLQASQEKQLLKMQQQLEMTENSFTEKVSAMETVLASLQKSFADCVRRSVHSESLDVQEKLSLITETLYNHLFDELRNVLIGKEYGVNKTSINVAKKEVHTAHQSAAKGMTPASEEKSGSTDSDEIFNDTNDFVGEEKEVPLLKTYEEDAFLMSGTETTFRHILHSELNTFLVNVQKLLLRPINSEDMSFHITEKITRLLQYEKNTTTDQLLSVQNAVSSDVQARLYKMEMCVKQELGRFGFAFEESEQLMLEEIQKLNKFLSSELPAIITSHLRLISVSKEKSSVKLDNMEVNDIEPREDVKQGTSQNPTRTRYLEKQLHGGNAHRSEGNGDYQTNVTALKIGNEHVQTIILMLSMYMLMFLIYRDTLSSKRIPLNSQTCETLPKLKKKKKKTVDLEPAKKLASTEHVLDQQQNADSMNLTDAHLKLMFGQYKEAEYVCKLNNSKISAGEDLIFKLDDVAPGYNLQLKANMNGNLNFQIMSLCGKQDECLIWPARFSITITLENKQLAGFRKDHWQTFTKTKTLFKPIKSKGASTPIPFCYFRDDLVSKCTFEGNLDFTVSVRYIGDGQKDEEF